MKYDEIGADPAKESMKPRFNSISPPLRTRIAASFLAQHCVDGINGLLKNDGNDRNFQETSPTARHLALLSLVLG